LVIVAYGEGIWVQVLKYCRTKRKGTIIGHGGVIKYTTLCKEKVPPLFLFMVLEPLHSTGGFLLLFPFGSNSLPSFTFVHIAAIIR